MSQQIAIYARQSVDKKDSLSIDAQVSLCKKEIGDAPSLVYIDKGFSGKNTNRPQFQKLLQDITGGKISKVVCYRLDRVSRSILDFGGIWNTCQAHSVEFVSINERFDTSTPTGRAMLYIIMIFAQLERETIAERITDNYYHRVKSGAWPGGPAPYGFTIEKINGSAQLVPGDNLPSVIELFKLYSATNLSLSNIAKTLNHSGLPSPGGSLWSSLGVGRILRNPVYAKTDCRVYSYYTSKGAICTNSIDEFIHDNAAMIIGKRAASDRGYTDISKHVLAICSHKGVIDADTFLAVQHKLDGNKQIKNTGKGKLSWLSGMLKCGKCGYSLKLIKDGKTGKIYLVCSGRTNYGLCTHRHSERIEDVEQEVRTKVISILSQVATQTTGNTPEISGIQNEIAKIDVKIENLISKLAEGSDITMTYINRELERLETERRGHQNVLSKTLGSKNPNLKAITYAQFGDLDIDEKKQLAKSAIEKVLLTDTSLEIIWRI